MGVPCAPIHRQYSPNRRGGNAWWATAQRLMFRSCICMLISARNSMLRYRPNRYSVLRCVFNIDMHCIKFCFYVCGVRHIITMKNSGSKAVVFRAS